MDDRRRNIVHRFMVNCFILFGINILPIFANEYLSTNVKSSDCYDLYGRAQRCFPEFENAAFNLRIDATNTCGEYGETHYCIQTQFSNKKSCDVCTEGSHSSDYLTDAHNPLQPTWWQSETMFDAIQYPNQVNLTLNLGKSFDITYIRLVFFSPRPESFAIYKRQTTNGTWVPYQYYSATCRDTYRLPDSLAIKRNEDESRALCTSEYSDISPLRDGNIVFSTLDGRPSGYTFENSTELQNFVTATDIRIVLQRLNTFGDEVFGDPQVLRSYFYAIADIAVGARCKCNGHANKCVESFGLDGRKVPVCQCRHNTDGPDCEKCLPFYNDAPWGIATSQNVHECKQCNCNGFSNKCYFDRHLYNLTKHGGHCMDCLANRDGANCERCREHFFMREDGACINCNCDPTGSRSLQCNTEGKCQCKPGVTGEKCDRCEENFYNFGQHGCQQCNCNEWGSLNNIPSCDPESGECVCKENVEGRRCRECKPGFFNLDKPNRFGCTPCFCYGHTSECQSAAGYSIVSTSSNFNKHKEKWNAVNEQDEIVDLRYNQFSQSIATATKPTGERIYFTAPERFLGDQRASYNRLLKFKLQLSGQIGPDPSSTDIILEGAGTRISLPIFAQSNSMPDQQVREYLFRLHENPEYSWQPSQSSRGFMSILSNLTSIKIRATYSNRGEANLDDVELQTAHRGAAGHPATWIEQCTCPTGYLGQFCESCAPGYRHSPALGGPFMPCIPCDCNKHAEICDSETGRCICQHNTAGDTCDQCVRGYYGNALSGTPYDCKKCPCPEDGACMQIADDSVICLECPAGYFGSRCELCSDGYFGDPTGLLGRVKLCKACDCNGNVDPNAVGNCNRTTGECLKCIHNTAGARCDECLPGHFGDPLATPHGKCEECSCYPPGTEQTEDGVSICRQVTGDCECKPNIVGRDCNECKNGFFNIGSGNGCEGCNCDSVGSFNSSCDRFSGQCYCKPGVTGQRCDKCVSNYYGFANDGCKACNCDRSGSKGAQCDEFGQCPCNDNVEGQRCDRCKENKYDRHQGCVDCPACYNLVQNAADDHRMKLRNLSKLLQEIASKPVVVDDVEFEYKLKYVQEQINVLTDDAKAGSGVNQKTPKERLDDFANRLKKVQAILNETNDLQAIADADIEEAERNVTLAKRIIDEASAELARASDLLKNEGTTALKSAKEKSDQLGQQSGEIGKISQAARTKSDDIIAESAKLKEIATQTLKTSNDAFKIAKDVITRQNEISEDLATNVSQSVNQQRENLNVTIRLVNNALDEANKAYDQTLTKFATVNALAPPEINVDEIKKEIQESKTEGQNAINNLEIATNTSVKVLSDFDENLELAEILLDRYTLQKEDALEMLQSTNKSYELAKEAVVKGDNILKEANNTYHTLAGFQNQVQNSSDEAKKALESVTFIEEKINKAKELNQKAEAALIGAQNNANEAKINAQDAQKKYAEEASKDAELIQKKANDTKAEAKKLRGEADQLAGRVAATIDRIEDLESKTKEDEEEAKDAKSKVGQAQADVNEAKHQVDRAINEVKVIIDDLSNLQDINIQDLDTLDKRLQAAEDELKNANLSARLDNLKELKNVQNSFILNYKNELNELEKEVENVKQIADALPEGCFKNVRLEV